MNVCGRCGGQVLSHYGEASCLSCGWLVGGAIYTAQTERVTYTAATVSPTDKRRHKPSTSTFVDGAITPRTEWLHANWKEG